jgi:hypothetical protein
MDDFELRLKTLPLATPPDDMKRRIFGDRPSRLWFVGIFRRRIPLGWAAALALVAGIAGMFSPQPWKTRAAPPLKSIVQVQIIKSPSDRNLLDFTGPAADWMPGPLSVEVQGPKEI